jgi:hypothetical protein
MVGCCCCDGRYRSFSSVIILHHHHSADHPEGNELAGVYAFTCRVCNSDKETGQRGKLRNSDEMKASQTEMMQTFNSTKWGDKKKAADMQKQRQQHMAKVW